MQYLNTSRGKLRAGGRMLGISALPSLSKISRGDEQIILGHKGPMEIEVRLKSIFHTIRAIGEIDSTIKFFAHGLVHDTARYATRTFMFNSSEIKGRFKDSWTMSFKAGRAPESTGNPFARRMSFFFGIKAGDKYYKPMGDKGGTIIDWLEYGTKPHNIFLKSAPGFFFYWPENPRTGSRGADTSLPIKGTQVFHGVPPTRDYIRHPGIRPYGFIRKTFGEMIPVFEGSVVGPIERLKLYIGVSAKGTGTGAPSGRIY